MTSQPVGATLRFAADAERIPADPPRTPVAGAGDVWLILDPAWTPTAADAAAGRLALRELAAEVLAREDLFPATTRLLDVWAEASGIVDAMTIDGTSFWYRRRLWAWRWLHERLIWIAILERVAARQPLTAIELPGPDEPALGEVATLVGRRDGLELTGEAGPADAVDDEAGDAADAVSPSGRGARPAANPVLDVVRGIVQSIGLRPVDRRRREIAERRATMDRRLDALIADPARRLLAITDPAVHQEVATATGRRRMDPFLGPVVERLAGTALDPIVLELGSRIEDDATWARLTGAAHARTLNTDTLIRRYAEPDDEPSSAASAEAMRAAIAGCRAALEIGGVDVGPALLGGLGQFAARALPARLREVARARRLLAALRPSAVLTIDEYGRTEWLSAARQLDIPVAAIQHGIVHAWHPGYQHGSRPAARPVPTRTYCFGDFERRLLLELGGYRPDEVVVSGSPRLDLVGERPSEAELDRLRAEQGVPPGERMLVVSTTFAAVYRRFYTPVALAALLGRPLPGVHIVIKLHPGEADGELYRRLLAGLGGGPRSDLSIVKRIDLYRLLTAAAAHLGLYSTVLTEAVVTGTPNLIAATQAASDLLGYVAAGVAIPVADGAGVRDALAADRPGLDPAARQAFLDDHFRPGSAADRIAADLLAWLGATPASERGRGAGVSASRGAAR